MTKRKLEKSRIKIPETLISEVDEMVIETGLYSDPVEFVADACRRLIIESKKKEVKVKSNGNDEHAKGRFELKGAGSKRALKRPDLGGDI